MDISQILGMLQNVSGPNAAGEYTARCPAHDDKTASLTLRGKISEKDGKERIYLCCHAGCENSAIMAALRITARDLIVNPDEPGKPARKTRKGGGDAEKMQHPGNADGGTGAKGAGAGKDGEERTGNGRGAEEKGSGELAGTGKTVHTAEKQEGPRPDWAHPDRVYSYTDEDGRELFQVVRLHYLDGAPGKTFRQRMMPTEAQRAEAKAGRIRISREGYVNSVPAELRDRTLYRLPRVIRAIADGRPVYVVEGEKDVETLERLGHTATCNPGGAGKWREGYSRRLEGADVIILPDNDGQGNDYTGQNHAYDVALKLRGYAKRIRLVDIREACPELPEKGDITDMVEIMGDIGAMDALARQVAATREFDPEAVPFWLTPMEQAKRLYGAVPGYGVADGCIVQVNGTETKALCDFVALPRLELIRDDGVTTSLNFVLDGWSSRGTRLGRVIIQGSELDNMNWVTGRWGFGASIMPGNAPKGKVAWAIKQVGKITAKQVTEYTHTGWRKIDGKWCYLYHGGAIGREGVTVGLPGALNVYRLDGGGDPGFEEIAYKDAARMSLRIQDVMRKDIGIALLGAIYLAPLREWLVQTDIMPAFALFLYGSTGTHKSTAAALAMSHFGNFHSKNAPASFRDTGNTIGKKAFAIKDMPILVDDYHPATSVQEKRQMAATAQFLSRAFGDGADRGRLNADSTLKEKTPPRSIAIITGEDIPDIGASGLARFFILDIEKEDIPVGDELTEMQELARRGYLQKAMRGYVTWLLKQTEELPERLHEQFLQYREMLRRNSSGQHDRAPETVACLLLGYNMMLKYAQDIGLLDMEAAVQLSADAVRRLTEVSRAQAVSLASEKPTRIFLDSLEALFASQQAGLKDLTAEKAKDLPITMRMVGYMDSEYYYLIPKVAFAAVQKLCREQGQEFPVTLRALYKHLRADGVLEGLTDKDSPARGKLIAGKVERVLWIPAKLMSGPKPEAMQTRMDGATEVSSDELPENWK